VYFVQDLVMFLTDLQLSKWKLTLDLSATIYHIHTHLQLYTHTHTCVKLNEVCGSQLNSNKSSQGRQKARERKRERERERESEREKERARESERETEMEWLHSFSIILAVCSTRSAHICTCNTGGRVQHLVKGGHSHAPTQHQHHRRPRGAVSEFVKQCKVTRN